MWDDFYYDIVGESWSTEDSARYVRVNPDLKVDPPALDDKGSLAWLQQKVCERLRRDSILLQSVEEVANRVFASSFFFRKLNIIHDQQAFTCIGMSLSIMLSSLADLL